MFHALVAGATLWVAAGLVAAPPDSPSLSLDEALARARPGLAAARLAAELTAPEALLGSSRGYLREGPSLDAQVGRRRLPGADEATDFGFDLELPLASAESRAARTALATRLEAGRGTLAAAARLDDRQLVLGAYLELWAAQQRLALRRDDERLLVELAALLERQIAAGAAAAYEGELFAGELLAARGLHAEAAAAELAAWARLRSLCDLPATPLPRLLEPSFPAADPPPGGGTPLLASSLFAAHELAAARSRFETGRELSRSSLALSLSREGDEDILLLGWRWRLPLSGERAAIASQAAGELAFRERQLARDLAEIEARRQSSLAALATLPAKEAAPAGDSAADKVWRAVELRVREGKASPLEALTIRRALLATAFTTLELELRRLTAQAELSYLNLETLP